MNVRLTRLQFLELDNLNYCIKNTLVIGVVIGLIQETKKKDFARSANQAPKTEGN